MIIQTLNMMILAVSIMVSIAFFTLMERKMIGSAQTRKGPNKVALIGILQPIADAIKLISKEFNLNLKSNFTLYTVSPMLNILMSLILWAIFPFSHTFNFMKMSTLFMIACMSINSITVIIMSWSSNSNYSFIGMIRSVAQLISYEVNFMLVILTVMNTTEQMNLNMMNNMQKYFNTFQIIPIMTILWMTVALAETSRTPFDFSEGESELVSGFNVEYSSKSFMFLFLAEYSNILLISLVSTIMFFNSQSKSMMITWYLMLCTIFIWTRATLPRFRYDKLMKFNWSQLLPITTLLFFVTFTMKMK